MATLAAAQILCSEAGVGETPIIPFGTRIMIVRDPKRNNAVVPKAEHATSFGLSTIVSGAYSV